jgi:hypothetical protein
VAPVARGVPDTEQDRHVALPRFRERIRTPLPPVDRVVLVLLEIRARRGAKTVHETKIPHAQGDTLAKVASGAE